jgi:hypothetical protein
MQQVSQAWIDAQQQTLVPESYVEVSLTVGDPDSQADASVESNGDLFLANTADIVTEVEQSPTVFATGELNIWGLDGTAELVPDEAPYGDQGYIGSELSGADCTFPDANPTLTVSFSQVFSAVIPGITIQWSETYNEWASAFTVTAYNGTAQVAQQVVTGNTDVLSVVSMDISNYDKIVVEVQEWCLPYHRARVEQLTIGLIQTYGKKEIMSYQHTIFADPLSGDLPNAEITFEVSNLNGQYNPDNPQGVEKYLMERQEITARYGYKLNGAIEWIAAGVFFMSEWNCPQNGITATFTARDAQEYMTDLYSGPSTGTLAAIATAAFQQAGLPTLTSGANRWEIDSSLSSITAATGADLSAYTIKEVLQLCANAACCALWQDRSGIFHIAPVAAGATTYPINQFNSYENSEISLSKQLKAVDINSGQYTLSVADVGDTQQITNPLISASQAPVVAQWVADYLVNRRTLSGEFRADPRLDALDRVVNTNDFSTSTVLVTEITYTYNGAFRGSYEGRAGA